MPIRAWEHVTIALIVTVGTIALAVILGAIYLASEGKQLGDFLSGVGGAAAATLVNWLVQRGQNPPPDWPRGSANRDTPPRGSRTQAP